MHIEELVQELKRNPLAYLVEEDVENVENFLGGYITGLKILKKMTEIDNLYDYFYRWIIKWIHKNHDPKFNPTRIAWDKNLSLVIPDKKEAYDAFFVIIEEFFDEYYKAVQFKKRMGKYMRIDDIIEDIKEHPFNYMSEKKVENIEDTLEVALFARIFYSFDLYDSFFEDFFLEWVKEWLHREKNMTVDEECGRYSQCIRKVAKDDEESFILFFEIEKEFRIRYHQYDEE